MNYAKFVGRKIELDFLKKSLNSTKFQLIPIWGRRRIGKTELILRALRDNKNGIYFLATESTEIENIKQFQKDSARCLNDQTVLDLSSDWESIFKYICKKDPIIVIDEFPYLIQSNQAIPSIFQRIIDIHLKNSSTKLILSGSSIRMMESNVVEYKAPLYGRRTGQIKLNPLNFESLHEFLPNYSFEDLVRVYGITGGVPMYILQFDNNKTFWKNVLESLLQPLAILYFEADILLKQEFTQLQNYRSILREIASGKTKMNEIRSALELGKSDISPYLKNLYSIELVTREVPVTEDPLKSRRSIYKIEDNYLKVYFRYILPNKSTIESGYSKTVLDMIKKDYNNYLGPVFEDICLQAFLKWSRDNGKPWDRIGRWWFKDTEIDIVAVSSSRNELMLGEIKWTKNPIKKKVVEQLITKADDVRWHTTNRKVKYILISRGGFSPECLKGMENKDIIFWTIDDLCEILWGKAFSEKLLNRKNK
jgi:AAA+ ATPase superfamily predicted ATPase